MMSPSNEHIDTSPEGKESGKKPKSFTIKFRRPRGSRACSVCRSRKVRCDAEIHIPCTNCITFGCECKLPEPKKRSSNAMVNEDQAEEPKTAKKQQINQVPLQKEAFSSEPVANISTVNVLSNISKLSNISLKKKKFMKFFGSTSSYSMILNDDGETHCTYPDKLKISKDESVLDSVEFEILKLRGAFLLPSKELSLKIINCYFEHVHPLLPVINRTEFMRRFKDPENQPSLMVLQAVLLSGSRVCKIPQLLDSNGTTRLAATTFFKRAKSLYEANYESDPVAILQTLLLISWYWEGSDDVTRNSFYWTRMAISLAQGFGFQRDVSNSPELSESDKKIWRRIWWCIFERDRTVAVSFGRPIVIDITDCDVPMITTNDFDEDEYDRKSEYPVNELHALYFIHMVKLAEITGIILKEQYSVRAESIGLNTRKLIIGQCDILMGIWFNNLPSKLVFSVDDPSSQNFYSCILNTQYYIRLYLVHRSYFMKMLQTDIKDGKIYPSWGISFKSAYMLSIIGKVLLHKNNIQYSPANLVYVYLTTLIMSVYYVDSPNDHVASSAYEIMNVCQSLLKDIGKVWSIADLGLQYFERYANDKIKRQSIVARMERHNEKEFQKAKAGNEKAGYEQIMNEKLTNTITFSTTEKIEKKPFTSESTAAPCISDLLNYVPNVPNFDSGHETTVKKNAIDGYIQSQSAIDTPQPSLLQSTQNLDIDQRVKTSSNQDSVQNPFPLLNMGEQTTIINTQSQTASSLEESLPDRQVSKSANSFPMLSLVTEDLPAVGSNFYENFDPTQLFPELPLSSYQDLSNGINYTPNNLMNYNSNYNFFSPTFNADQYNYDAQAVSNEDFKNTFGRTAPF